MTAPELMERCRALAIDLTAGPDGGLLVDLDADSDPPPELLADLKSRKAELLDLLAGSAATVDHLDFEADPLDMPAGARLYFQDERGRPCEPAAAYLWCWEGGPTWYRTAELPIPGFGGQKLP